MREIAERHGLSLLQLACQWNLAHEAVECCAPTLIQEAGPDAVPVEDKRADLAATPREVVLSAEEVEQIRTIGDNTGCMTLKGATPDHDGEEQTRPLAADARPRGSRRALANSALRTSNQQLATGARGTAYPFGASSISLSSLFSTFPVAFLGSSSKNQISRGTLKFARFCFT